MKKKKNEGFVLVETLLVTVFVAGVLVFLFIQFSNLSKAYEESYNQNTVEGIYALEDIRDYILSDSTMYKYIEEHIDTTPYIDVSECYYFTNREYCKKLFEYENLERVIILKNQDSYPGDLDLNEEIQKFINQISNTGTEKYRLVALFKNATFATLRFGE